MLKQLFTCSAALTLLLGASNLQAGPIDLGDAENYTLLSVGTPWTSNSGGTLVLGSAAEIYGNVGARNYLGFSAAVSIHGDVDGGALVAAPDAQIDGSYNTLDSSYWDGLYADLTQASAQAAAMAGSSFGSILDSMLFSAYGGLSVFNINGDLNLDTGESLVLKGSASDQFIINVSQNFMLGSGASILLDGVSADNVLFNFTGGGGFQAAVIGGANFSGTYLAPNMDWIIGDGATMNSTRVLVSGIQGNLQTVHGITTEVPEPSALLLLGVGLLGLGALRSRR